MFYFELQVWHNYEGFKQHFENAEIYNAEYNTHSSPVSPETANQQAFEILL